METDDTQDPDKDRAPPGPGNHQGEAVHEQPPRSADAAEAEQPADAAEAEEAAPPPGARLDAVIESLLFAAEQPLTVERLREILDPVAVPVIRQALEELEQELLQAGRGVQLHQVAGGYQLRTAPEHAPFVQKLLKHKPVRLTRAQLETLAIIAYRQPITRPEIDDIRGVDSGGTLKTLLERRLLRILGKKEEPGRPMLYGTTREFLEFFNLRDLKDLPTLREFHELSDEHQAQVSALEGLGFAEPEAEPPPPPPPLTRVELRDLNLGDDEAELARIDEMIQSVRVDLPVDGPGAPPAAGSEAKEPEAPGKEAKGARETDEREPEEL